MRALKRRLRKAQAFSLANGHRQVALEIFSGSGQVAAELRKLGIGAVEIDIVHGFHVTDKRIINLVVGWIVSRVVGIVWVATPCASWSRRMEKLDFWKGI